ncbi:MAG: tyrosine-type recombinase/integrase [Crocinitomicaceae bacterium]|nr:tyrosine-type recombinase/integrase [Crocinitomicaceae bacterium]
MKLEFENYLLKKFEKKTYMSYRYAVERFKSLHAHPEKCNYMQIVEYLAELNQQGYSHAYRVANLSALKQYFTFLFEAGIRTDHPCKHLKINDYSVRGICFDDLLTPEELEGLFDRPFRYRVSELRNAIIISLLVYQALSSQEICKLKIDDIDFSNCTIYIKRSGHLDARLLEMHRKQVLLFSDYIEKVRPELNRKNLSEFLINKLGNAENVDSIQNVLVVMKAVYSSKKVTAQNIRISVIANWLNYYHLPLADVQLMAGHRWPTTTQKYVQVDLNKMRNVINRFHPMETMFDGD